MSNRRKTRRLPGTTPMRLDLVVVDHGGNRVLQQAFPVDIPDALMDGDYNVSVLLNPRTPEGAATVANHTPEN